MPLPVPTAGEDQASFMKRGHEALASEFPKTDQRNAVLFRQWREHHGESEEEKRAHSMFASGEFVEVKDIPVFKEHEYVEYIKNADGSDKLDADGNAVVKVHRYGFDELKEICEKANYRIRDTGDFAPLTLGHTKTNPKNPGESASHEDQPRVAGFSGPYSVGKFGNEDPKWTIFANEYHYADTHEEVKRCPRRSPELFLSKSKRFFDPIAALGAVTPRLDLGIHYEMSAEDEQVVRYSCPYVAHYEMAACPGGGAGQNVTLPEDKKQKSEQPTSGEGSMLSDEDIRRILEAFRATPEQEWVRQQMEASKAPKAEDEPVEGAPPVGEDQPVAPKEQAEEGKTLNIDKRGEEEGGAGPVAEEPEDKSEKEDEMAPAVPAKKDKEEAHGYSADEFRDLKVKYQALEQKHLADNARIQAIENTARMTVRTAKLEKLRRNYAFDLDKQVEKCAADRMNDVQFEDHLNNIVENFKPIPINVDLFAPALDDDADSKQRNERDIVQAAVKYQAEMQRSGKYIKFDEAKAHVTGKAS